MCTYPSTDIHIIKNKSKPKKKKERESWHIYEIKYESFMEAQELYLEQSKTVQTKTNNNKKHD